MSRWSSDATPPECSINLESSDLANTFSGGALRDPRLMAKIPSGYKPRVWNNDLEEVKTARPQTGRGGE